LTYWEENDTFTFTRNSVGNLSLSNHIPNISFDKLNAWKSVAELEGFQLEIGEDETNNVKKVVVKRVGTISPTKVGFVVGALVMVVGDPKE